MSLLNNLKSVFIMNELKNDLREWTLGYVIAVFIFLPIINYIFHLLDVKILDTVMKNLLLLESIGFVVYYIFITVIAIKHVMKS